MDPQKNVNPTASDEDKDTSPQTDVSQEPTTTTAPNDDLSMGAGVVADATAPKDESAMPAPSMEDESQSASTDVAFGGDQTTTPSDPASVPAPTPASDATPEAAAPVTPQEPVAPAAPISGITMPSDDTSSNPQTPLGGTTVSPGEQPSVMPQTAPVASTRGDKKTIFVLIGVAVVLIAAIAVLYFM